MNILWCCACNINRSPTLELYFKTLYPEHQHKSAGIYVSTGNSTPLNQELCDWADWIFVMDIEQLKWFAKHHPFYLDKLDVIGIPDEFDRYSWDLAWTINVWNNWRKPFEEVRTFSKYEWDTITEHLQ